MELHEKVRDINNSLLNGQPKQALSQLKGTKHGEHYAMSDVLLSIYRNGEVDNAVKLACMFIDEAY